MNYFRSKQSGPKIEEVMAEQHDAIRMKLDKLEEVQAKQRAVRIQLDHLTKLGDLITTDDVLSSASHIVAAGVDPMQMATLLTDMPEQPEALRQWVVQQDQQIQQKEQQLDQVLGMVRHETGLAALRMLAAQHMDHQQEQSQMLPGQDMAGSNGMMPQGQPSTMMMPGAAGQQAAQSQVNPLMGDLSDAG